MTWCLHCHQPIERALWGDGDVWVHLDRDGRQWTTFCLNGNGRQAEPRFGDDPDEEEF